MNPVKTYVLLEHTESHANVFVRVNQAERVRLKTRVLDHAYNQITFMDRDGKNKTIRLKLQTDEIYLDAQIKDKQILANEKYTQEERDAVRFNDGVLISDNPTVQKFLEAHPQFEGFWIPDKDGKVGRCPSIMKPLYKLYDETVELKSEDEFFFKSLKAANKIAAIKTVKEGQELMYRLNGSSFKAPDDLLKIRAELIRYHAEADDKMIDALLQEDVNIDEKVVILIGRAVNAGILSFDKVPDQVVKIKNGKPINLKQISSEYSDAERERYFSEFLTSDAGKLLMKDLEKDVEEADKKTVKEKVKEPVE